MALDPFLAFILIVGGVISGWCAGVWFGRQATIAAHKAEVAAMLRDDDQREEAAAFLKSYRPGDERPLVKRGAR